MGLLNDLKRNVQNQVNQGLERVERTVERNLGGVQIDGATDAVKRGVNNWLNKGEDFVDEKRQELTNNFNKTAPESQYPTVGADPLPQGLQRDAQMSQDLQQQGQQIQIKPPGLN